MVPYPKQKMEGGVWYFLDSTINGLGFKGLKCVKSLKQAAFTYVGLAVNDRFHVELTTKNVEKSYRTLKS